MSGIGPQPPEADDRPPGRYGLLQPGGCLVPVKYPQAEAERGDFEAGA